MNKALFKDPLFWAGALAVSFGLFQLASQNITLPSFSSAGSIKTFNDPTPGKVQASQATVNMLNQVNQYQQAAKPKDKIDEMIKKSRPKSSDNIWRVGTSDLADSADLSLVIKNLEPGDVISLESGSYQLKFETGLGALLIEGLPDSDAKITLEDSYALRYIPTNFTLRNLTFDLTEGSTSIWFSGWNQIIEFDQVKVIGDDHDTIYLRDGVTFNLKRSTVKNVSFDLNDFTKSVVEDSTITELKLSAFKLQDEASLQLKNVKISRFSSAISFGKGSPKFAAENIEISEGHDAFYASRDLSRRIDVKKGKFSKLRRVLMGDKLRILCEDCSEQEISSAY